MRLSVGLILATASCLLLAKPAPRNSRKVEFKSDIIPIAAFVDQKLDLDLNSLLKGPGSGPLAWSTGPDMPKWLTLNSAGSRLTGTPASGDLGTKSFRLGVQDGDSGALARIDITVYPPPKWTQNPLDLGEQNEDSFWTYDLKTKITNPGGGKLTFTVEDPAKLPEWMTLESSGILSGTPRRKHVGKYSGIPLVVSSALGGTDKTLAKGEVMITIKPPKWKVNPIMAANAAEDFPYSFDLAVADYVSNPEGTLLTYELLSGAPPWLKMTNTGTLYGDPKKADLGVVNARVKLSATIMGKDYTDETAVTFEVKHTNHPPKWTMNPVNLPDAPVKIPYLQDLMPYAKDDDGDPITFKIVSGPAWAKITTAGILGGTPSNSDFGLNEWTVEVSDGEFPIPAQIRVKVVNKPPYWLAKPTVLPMAQEDDNYIQNLIPLVKDPDGDPVVFKVISGPSWITVTPSGALSGMPGGDNVGLNKWIIQVADNVSGFDEAEIQVTVTHVNHPPKWTQDPVNLPNAKEKIAYTQSLRPYVTDKDKGDTLTFTKVAGPGWATVSADGTISGTPMRVDVGMNTFRVKVADQTGASAEASIIINVEKTNKPPIWTQDPIDLGETLEDTALSLSLVKYVLDPDGDALTFRKVNGPAWVEVAADGQVSGIPKKPDVGAYTVTFEVTDGEYPVQAKGNGTVKAKTMPPIIHTEMMSFTVKERQTFNENLNQAKYVEDPQGLPLTFTLVDTAAWVTLTNTGALTLKPEYPQIGNHNFRIKVTNGKLTTDGNLLVTVVRDPRPPIWLEDPIRFSTLARIPFQNTIAAKAKDLDNLPLTFTKVSGPDWLTIDANGKISGTPGDADVGENKFVVSAKNDMASANAQLIITVMHNNHPPYWTQEMITLTVAYVGQPYSQPIHTYAKDPDPQDVLTITKVSGPTWVNVSAGGIVSGTPAKTDIGTVTMKVRVTDPSNASAEATVTFPVEKMNAPPVWLQEPVNLGEITEEQALAFDVTKFAYDADSDPLTYKKATGPAWLELSPAGMASGTPKKADIGDFQATFEVTDGKASATVKAIGKVVPKNNPPILHVENLIFTVKERDVFNVNLNDPKYVEDPDGNSLVFTLIDSASWVTLGATGALNLSPLHAHLGDHSFKFKVFDGKATVEGTLKVTVLRSPQPPLWLEDPIRFTADARVAFSANVANKAQDKDGMPLTFEKKSGPAWLTMDATGKISGTPADSDVGENTFKITAKNDGASADATLIITVRPTNHAPIVHNEALNFTMKEREVLTVALTDKKYVEDVDNDALIFQGTTSLEWVSLSSNGSLVLKPLHPQIGTHTYNFTVSDGKLGANGTITITVLRDPRPPIWLEDPIIFNATSREPFNASIEGKAKDQDNLPITYEKKSGPAWLMISPQGKLYGTPADTDVGDNTFVVIARNDTFGTDGRVIVKVSMGNHAPIVHDEALSFVVKERQVLEYNLTDKIYVEDPDNDSLTFSWLPNKDFAQLSPAGKLTLAPQHGDIGNHSLAFKVTDGKLTAQGVIKIRVLRDPRPPIWLENPIRFQAKIGRPFTAFIGDKVKELDNMPVTFTKKSGDPWLSIDTKGNLSGTPPDGTPLGDNAFIFTASNDGSASDGTIIINIIPGNNPPVWLQDPINLGSIDVGKLLQVSIASQAIDKDGDPLTFEKLSGPGWLFVSPNGTVTGTPAEADVGVASMRVRVSDPMKAFADATVTVIVVGKQNRPPVWLQDPIDLGTTAPDAIFQFNLAPLAMDPDGDGLTFKKVTGPAWLFVGTNGMIQGRPTTADIGSYVASFEVSDGKLAVVANAFGSVKSSGNNPPIVKPEALSFVVKERSELAVNINQPQYVVDPEGDPLTFEFVNPVSWITLTSNGQMVIKPLFPHIGDHSFILKISDNKSNTVQATMFVRVVRDPRPPIWLENPIRMEATVNQPFSNTLAGKAKDEDNLPLTFSKVSGPSWLSIAPSGVLSGTPASGDLGENTFTVTVKNDLLSANATLIITVKSSGPQIDTQQVDKAVAGAPSENLWVIDNSWPWLDYNKLANQLKDNIHIYYQALEAAGVRSTGLYLSSDVDRWKGIPNQGEDSSIFIQWSDPQVAPHFVSRVNETYNKKCYTSPIWAMWKFYQYGPSNSEISSRFFTEGVPMDVLIATPHADHYKTFSKGTAQASWTPNDYTREFMALHDREKQNYRVSAIASECQKMLDPMGEEGQTAKDNPYRVLVKATKGDYFTWDCHFNMAKTLKEYAQKVIFRAYVMANSRVRLSKKPDPASIQVSVGGKPIMPPKWSYDSSKNEVVIAWSSLDISTLMPGDLIEVRYNAIGR